MSQRIQKFTADEVLVLLRKRLEDTTQRGLAAKIGVTQQYLCDVLKERRPPGPAILSFLGLEVAFVKKERAA